MKATLYWNQKEGHSNVVVEDKEGNPVFEREVSKGDNNDGWFGLSATEKELREYLEQEEIDADQFIICDSY